MIEITMWGKSKGYELRIEDRKESEETEAKLLITTLSRQTRLSTSSAPALSTRCR